MEFGIKRIEIKMPDLDSRWSKWVDQLHQSIYNSMKVPSMRTIWIDGHPNLRPGDLRPGDRLDFCSSQGVVATLEVIATGEGTVDRNPVVELLVPPATNLPVGLLVRSAFCTWILNRTILGEGVQVTRPPSFAPGAFLGDLGLPSPQRKLFLVAIDENLRHWHTDGKEKALHAVAEELVAVADSFIGMRQNPNTANAVRAKFIEINALIKDNVPDWAYREMESGIHHLAQTLTDQLLQDNSTHRFRQEILGQPYDDPSIHIANTDAMLKAREREEEERRARRVARPDAPWKIE